MTAIRKSKKVQISQTSGHKEFGIWRNVRIIDPLNASKITFMTYTLDKVNLNIHLIIAFWLLKIT